MTAFTGLPDGNLTADDTTAATFEKRFYRLALPQEIAFIASDETSVRRTDFQEIEVAGNNARPVGIDARLGCDGAGGRRFVSHESDCSIRTRPLRASGPNLLEVVRPSDNFLQLSQFPTMKDTLGAELAQLGLTPAEAQVYLALVQNGSLGASAIAAATGLARTSVYPTLGSLVDKGLVDAGEGYGSRFAAVPAEQALPNLMVSDKEALLQRERITSEVIQRISSVAERDESAPTELIQVIRSPRAVAERFERLQLAAQRQIDVFTKPPFFSRTGNPAQEKALRGGVHARSIYEKAALDDPAVKPYFEKWLTTGEEARIYDGELPLKMAIFDSQVVLMPLIMPGEQTRALLIHNPQLAQSLCLAFQFVWERSAPVSRASRKTTARPAKSASAKQISSSNSAR